MDLEALHAQVKQAILSLDFDVIWPGFKPLRFALYDHKTCCFDGRYIEKTDDFCANTSIVYQGEQIAIWMVQQEMEISILASKIVHEMFHGYQNIMGWDCWPNELEALYRYEYNAENLSLKLYENKLLLAMLEHFDDSLLKKLLAHRKLRSTKFPYEFSYESKVEEIEGTANYVEWQALKQLDGNKADELVKQMHARMTEAEYLFPARISCYDSGALMIDALRHGQIYSFSATKRQMIASILENVAPSDENYSDKEVILTEMSDMIRAFHEETDAIIKTALEKNDIVLDEPVELTGVNIYDARCYKGFITTTYFVMYRTKQESKMLQGNYVIHMQDEKTIAAIYRWV
ncbi:MAG: hypothetical protein J6Z03_00295 [Erysipelotrichaceae bacterium]|nr:hypothetical protein [Erysipelotrichaceae bacterium]